MTWTVTERRYHGRPDGRHVVHLEGALRGPVECSDADEARRIAAILNTCAGLVEFTGQRLRRYGWENE